MTIPVGTVVMHQGYGLGTVIGHNGVKPNKYFNEKPLDAMEIANQAGLISGIFASMYSGDVYPNIVLFECGYKDVYADIELETVN